MSGGQRIAVRARGLRLTPYSVDRECSRMCDEMQYQSSAIDTVDAIKSNINHLDAAATYAVAARIYCSHLRLTP